MGDKPLLSICIPTYNRPAFLKQALHAIFSQCSNEMLKKIEVVISDNHSSEDTFRVVNDYASFSKHLKYHRNSFNVGSRKNVINVVTYATGSYLRLLADDDCPSDFAISYVLDIIEHYRFDVLFSRTYPVEDISTKVPKKPNTVSVHDGIRSYLSFLGNHLLKYQDLISFFSFYSAIIVRRSYFVDGLSIISHPSLNSIDFPHELIVYRDLIDKKIIVPDNVLVLARMLNESYTGSFQLISDFRKLMNYIEQMNHLKGYPAWAKIKNICVRGWTNTMLLGILLRKLHIDYKNNRFLKRIYYLYKQYIQ